VPTRYLHNHTVDLEKIYALNPNGENAKVLPPFWEGHAALCPPAATTV
jgi:hypothetical protein